MYAFFHSGVWGAEERKEREGGQRFVLWSGAFKEIGRGGERAAKGRAALSSRTV